MRLVNATNGSLLGAAELAKFDELITTDRNLQYQQNLSGREIAIIVLSSTSWPRIRTQIALVEEALATIAVGGFVEIES